MMVINSKAKQALKARAHKLKPVVLIGNQGLTDAVTLEIDRALNDHELIKIRMAGNDRLARRQAYEQIAAQLNAALIQSIGSVGVFYRKNK